MSIYKRRPLGPSQMRTVADRRFEDAHALRQTGKNARANGAIYLGGFVVEILLKAQLLARFPWLMNASPHVARPAREERLYRLFHQSHRLNEILAEVPCIATKLSQLEQGESIRLTQSLKSICAQWTIFARYSPETACMDEASDFLDQIKELKPWLT